MEDAPASHSRRWLAAAILFALCLGAYANCFHAAFAQDSVPLILGDARVHDFTSDNAMAIVSGPYWPPEGDPNLYRPLVKLAWMTMYSLLGFGTSPEGYHAVNLAVHAVNCWLVFCLLFAAVKRYWLALSAAALFAAHPVNTEAVTNISGLADLLCAAIVLGAMAFDARRNDAWTGWRAGAGDMGMLLAGFACLSAKESGIVLLPLLLIYDLAFRRPAAWTKRRWRVYAAVATGAAVELAIRHAALAHGLPAEVPFLDNPLTGAGFLEARLTACGVLWRYLGLLIFPWKLSTDYSYNQISLLPVWLGGAAAVGLAALLAGAVAAWRRSPALFFCGLWFFAAIFPVSNVALLIGSIMAERFLYLPAVGAIACLAIGVEFAARAVPGAWRGRTQAVLCCAIAAAFATRTLARNRDWASDTTLWSRASEASPNAFRPYWVLGNLHAQEPEGWAEAASNYQKAIDIVRPLPPEQSRAILYSSMARLWLRRADSDARAHMASAESEYGMALSWYRDAERIDRAHIQAVQSERRKRGDDLANEPDPGDWDLYGGESGALSGLNRLAEAEQELNHAIRISIADDRLYSLMAVLESRIGNSAAALEWRAKALLLGKTPAEMTAFADAFRAVNPGSCEAASAVFGGVNFSCEPAKAVVCRAEASLIDAFKSTGHAEHVALYRRNNLTGEECSRPQ